MGGAGDSVSVDLLLLLLHVHIHVCPCSGVGVFVSMATESHREFMDLLLEKRHQLETTVTQNERERRANASTDNKKEVEPLAHPV